MGFQSIVSPSIPLNSADTASFDNAIVGYEWRYQIGPWVRRGYRVVAPDMLGYGGTVSTGTLAVNPNLELTQLIPGQAQRS